MKLVFGILVSQSNPFYIRGHGLDCGHLPSVGFAAQAAVLESLGMPPPRHLGFFAPTRTGLTRRSVGVYLAPSKTFTSVLIASTFTQPDGVHLESVYRRRAGKLLVIWILWKRRN